MEHLKKFNYLKYIRAKATPEFILSRIREIYNLYPLNVQFLCSGGRKESISLVPKPLKLKNIQELDLQLLHDSCLI